MSFLSDTFSNNTTIFPIVTIEPIEDYAATSAGLASLIDNSILLSTNNVSLLHINSIHAALANPNLVMSGHHFKPLLSKMPTINQSVDTKTRRFKVSNVTINILNNEYQGEKFSDIFIDNSLINWLVSVQLVSPSANFFSTISPFYTDSGSHYDYYSTSLGGSWEALGESHMTRMVYQGRIRDAYQNKESVTLKLEDILGQKSHATIPTIFTGFSPLLPQKRHGSPIPIVFGEVKRSPVVMDVIEDEIVILGEDINASNGGKFDYSIDDDGNIDSRPLLIYKDTFYLEAYAYHKDIWDSYTNYQNDSGGTEFCHYSDNSQYSFIDGEPLIRLNHKLSSTASEDNVGPLSDNLLFVLLKDNPVVEKLKTPEDNYSVYNGSAATNIRAYRYNHTEWDEWNRISNEEVYDGGGTYASPGDWVDEKYVIEHRFGAFPGQANVDVIGTSADNKIGVKYIFDGGYQYNSVSIPSGTTDGGGTYTDFRIYLKVQRPNSYNSDETVAYHDVDDGDGLSGGQFDDVYWPTEYNLSSASSSAYERFQFFVYIYESGANNLCQAQFRLYDYNIRREAQYMVENATESDFYGHVIGRTDGNDLIENPISIMKYIAEEFLNADVDQASYDNAYAHHAEWKFNFSIYEVINTKTLLEDIAASTRCFVRFNESGKLAFHTIQDDWETVIWDNAIPVEDAISYVFKQSSLKDIASDYKISFDKDYGQDKYLNSIDYDSSTWSEYYGVTDIVSHFNCDYTSDFGTAVRMVAFHVAYYQNRRLIADLTLGFNHSNIKVGDIIKFPDLLGGETVHGADYTIMEMTNAQYRYPLFIVTSVKIAPKNLKIKAQQLHCLNGVPNDLAGWLAVNS